MTKWAGRFTALLCSVALLISATPAAAAKSPSQAKDRQAEIKAELRRIEGQLDEAEAQEAAIVAELNTVRSRRDALNRQVAGLDADLRRLEGELAGATAQLEEAQARTLAAKAELDAATAELRRARDTLRAQAVTAYTGSSGIDLLTGAVANLGDADLLNVSATYLESVLDAQHAVVEQHEVAKDRIEELAAVLEGAQARAMEIRDDVAQRHRDMESIRDEHAAVLAQVEAEAAHEAKLLAAARTKLAQYEARKDALTQESSSIAAFLRRTQTTTVTPHTGRLGWPLHNPRITSYYGNRVHPIFGTTRLHAGLDFGAGHGVSVLSAAAGEVLYAGWRNGYGNTVIIDHGGGLATLYAHLSGFTVNEGQVVGLGQTVARVGSTGFSTGPHLHFETRVGGNPVDPLQFL